MTHEPRRTLDELITKYELEPELRDIFVEGRTDKAFFEYFLQGEGIQNVVVYEIDTIDIPTQSLFDVGLKDGNRGRVITLALSMENRLPENSLNITCIADKDFDWLFQKQYQCNLLLFTDYSCLEMYLFDEEIVSKFLLLNLRLSQPPAQELLNLLAGVLEKLFLIRATNEALQLEMDWLDDFGGCCEISSNGGIDFDSGSFIEKFLNKNSKMKQKSEFMAKLTELRQKKLSEIRYKIHGHDFTELLSLYIKPKLMKNIKSLYNSEIIARGLFTSVDFSKLRQKRLFQNLLWRIFLLI